MLQKATQITRPLAISTPLGNDELLLQRFVGSELVSGLFQFRLDLLSTRVTIEPHTLLGQNVTFVVRCENGRPRYFNGYVSRFEAGAMTPTGDYRKYRAEVVPWLWFLGRTTDCRIFQNKTVPTIVRQVFRDLGFTDFKMSGLKGTYPQRVYCVQYRETDLDFVCRLLEEEGIYFYFVHNNGKHTLVLSDSVAGYRWCRERELHYEPTRGPSPGEDRITAWEHRYAFRSGKLAHTDYNFETPAKKLMAAESSQFGVPSSASFELYDYPGEYEQRQDGRRLARVRIEEEELGYDTVVAESSCPWLGAGCKFTLRDAQLSAESGQTRLVTAVEHRGIEPNVYETVGEADQLQEDEPVYGNLFTCIPSSVCYRPARETPRPVMRGVQTAMVVGPKGEEIYPDQYGRVKVQFHWDREGKRDENSSCWLRVSQRHAGKGWGDIDLPRIGEEVIVDFLEGDPDRPIVKGRVYNAEKPVPFSLPGSKTRSGGKSDTHKGSGYNEMTMDDTAGAEQLRVNAQHNMDTVIGNNETLQVGVDRATDIGNNDSLEIAVDGALEVGNDAQITVGNDATYVVGNNVEITAGVAITLKCGASTIHMNQAGVISISGSYVTSAARANNSIVAPITSITGSNMLLQAGVVVLDLGGVKHVKGSETTVAGANVSVMGAGETIMMGTPLKLGEVGAPLKGLPKQQSGDSSSAGAGAGGGGGGGGGAEGDGGSTGGEVGHAESENQPGTETDQAPAKEPSDAPQTTAETDTDRTDDASIHDRRMEISEELARDDLPEERRDELIEELGEIDRNHPGLDDDIPASPNETPSDTEAVETPHQIPQTSEDPPAESDTKVGVKTGANIGRKGSEAGVAVYTEQKLSESEEDLGIFTAKHERTMTVETGTGTNGGKVKGTIEDKVGVTNPVGDELYCKGGGSVDSNGKGSAGGECGLKAALDKDTKIGVSLGRSTDPKIVSVETKTDDTGTSTTKVCASVHKLGSACLSYEKKGKRPDDPE